MLLVTDAKVTYSAVRVRQRVARVHLRQLSADTCIILPGVLRGRRSSTTTLVTSQSSESLRPASCLQMLFGRLTQAECEAVSRSLMPKQQILPGVRASAEAHQSGELTRSTLLLRQHDRCSSSPCITCSARTDLRDPVIGDSIRARSTAGSVNFAQRVAQCYLSQAKW